MLVRCGSTRSGGSSRWLNHFLIKHVSYIAGFSVIQMGLTFLAESSAFILRDICGAGLNLHLICESLIDRFACCLGISESRRRWLWKTEALTTCFKVSTKSKSCRSKNARDSNSKQLIDSRSVVFCKVLRAIEGFPTVKSFCLEKLRRYQIRRFARDSFNLYNCIALYVNLFLLIRNSLSWLNCIQ